MKVSLPESLTAFVEQQVASGKYASVEQYLGALIEADQQQKARTVAELGESLPILTWVAEHALPSGILAEQLHPVTGAPLSVSPLTWSHAEVVATVMAWLEKRQSLDICGACKTPRFFFRGAGATEARPLDPEAEGLY